MAKVVMAYEASSDPCENLVECEIDTKDLIDAKVIEAANTLMLDGETPVLLGLKLALLDGRVLHLMAASDYDDAFIDITQWIDDIQ